MGATPIPAARSPADTVGGPGGLPRGKFEKKDSKWWHLMVFAVKILIYKFCVFFIFFVKFSKLNTATKLKIELYQVII